MSHTPARLLGLCALLAGRHLPVMVPRPLRTRIADTREERWRYRERVLLQGVSTAPLISERQMFFVTNAGFLNSFVVP